MDTKGKAGITKSVGKAQLKVLSKALAKVKSNKVLALPSEKMVAKREVEKLELKEAALLRQIEEVKRTREEMRIGAKTTQQKGDKPQTKGKKGKETGKSQAKVQISANKIQAAKLKVTQQVAEERQFASTAQMETFAEVVKRKTKRKAIKEGETLTPISKKKGEESGTVHFLHNSEEGEE